MPSWSAFQSAAPELAAQVRALLDAHVHKTIATIRKDGSPRISGTEARVVDGELWIGSMWEARKALDLRRDPRYALHSGSIDPPDWAGDTKVAGVVEEITDPVRVREINGEIADLGPTHLFCLDVREASTVVANADGTAVVITSWTPDRGLRTLERA
ncbi:pyridoxamine 5'-phosphate oxidase family protein [Patulibacter minatonensis]|uniref:pyridoxamine 5'-phosphate oxidase family protein n=1 Tax=Patulibacter minatonensis TaxID=298163 RepID=UPI00047BEC60|nr:pyridoxamine 5'-phosphate oxidase family protein [Patulibacter minatonensis]